MQDFSLFVDQIEGLANAGHGLTEENWKLACASSLNGAVSRTLREVVPREQIRSWGAYFTPPSLASMATKSVIGLIKDGTIIFDPACGAGDLLLSVALHLPLSDSLESTVADWGDRLWGLDLQPEFIRACKARLILLAIHRLELDSDAQHQIEEHAFPNILPGDALSAIDGYRVADIILMNPPFGLVQSPADCDWAGGQVNAASIFVTTAISRTRPNSKLVAILPDVLRSGHRYEKWREKLRITGHVLDTCSAGHFGSSADVEVFILQFQAGKPNSARKADLWDHPKPNETQTIADMYDVRVGPVVPHRHAESGPEYRYIHARSLPPWGTLKRINERRNFAGTTFRPPFVAVRRTSRPDGKKRAVATIVEGKKNVAVENHVLVLLPHDGTIDSCLTLIDQLKSNKTDKWLNQRIRCKHLTVAAIGAIPWWITP